MTRNEIIESAHACMNHAGHCDKCEWDNRACWGGMSKTEAADWMIGEHRLTPEEKRLLELGRAVEEGYLCGGCVLLDGMEPFDTTEEVLDWYRKEATE